MKFRNSIFSFVAMATLFAGFGNASAEDLLRFPTTLDLGKYKNHTFFYFMTTEGGVVDNINKYATDGFQIAEPSVIREALLAVDDKVSRKALRSSGGQAALEQLAANLSEQGNFTLYTLPDAVRSAPNFRGDMYGIATFLALASGAGVAVRVNDDNYYYNVNYGDGKHQKDEQTGRSFGAGPAHKANDASDAFYLREVENYVRNDSKNPSELYRVILEVLTNCDVSNYSRLSASGQTVATDFLAIYTAEEDRHLMSNLRTHDWDTALAEVTLLSALHAGQKDIMVMHEGKLKKLVPDQITKKERAASLIDWWQFSKQPGSRRSGINLTRKDFRALGAAISAFERENHPELVDAIEAITGKSSGNVFAELTGFLINRKTPTSLGKKAGQLTEAFVAFLDQVRKDANDISDEILAGNLR